MADFTIKGENEHFDVPSDYTPLIFRGETDERGVSGVAWEDQLVSVPLHTWTETNIALSHYKEQTDAWRMRWADENDRAEAYRCDLERLRSDIKAAASIEGEED